MLQYDKRIICVHIKNKLAPKPIGIYRVILVMWIIDIEMIAQDKVKQSLAPTSSMAEEWNAMLSLLEGFYWPFCPSPEVEKLYVTVGNLTLAAFFDINHRGEY